MIKILAKAKGFHLPKYIQRNYSTNFLDLYLVFGFYFGRCEQNIYHLYWFKKIVIFDLICIVLMMFQEDLNSSCNGIRIPFENAFTTCVWNQGSFQSTTLRRSCNKLKKMFECNALQKLIVF